MIRFSKYIYPMLTVLVIATGIGPLLLNALSESSVFSSEILLGLNLLGWSFVLLFMLSKLYSWRSLAKSAKSLGIDPTLRNHDQLFKDVLFEIKRKNQALSINLIQRKVSSPDELSSALEKIVSRAYSLLEASSAELALFEESSGLYHSALLVGKPFKTESQSMLSAARVESKDDTTPDIIIQPIIFAGTVLGTLRVALKPGNVPTAADREIINLLSLQAGIALMNAEYSKQLFKMTRSSEESIKARTGFLANLSHEIRGPLGIMLNAVELILEGICGSVTDEQTKTLGMIQSNGKHLLDLINDVLDYSKVESGKLHPKKTEILLEPILKDITTIIRSQAIEKGHKLNYQKTPENLAIHCDKRHLRQMLINLLTNAVKYTPQGGVIEVWAERTAGNRIKINVKDSGIGIAEVDREKVFAPFERIENSYAMTQVGTGLGMPLTRRLAEVNGGNIEFSSEVNKGSTFWLDFAATEAPKQNEEKKEDLKIVEGKGDVVLLVEKDVSERDMIGKYLSKVGFSVIAAANKSDASSALKERTVSILVIDNNVSDNPKDNVMDFVRSSTNLSLPIIMLTSHAFVADIKRFLKEGADRCLVKPVPLQELANICRNLIDGNASMNLTDVEVEAKDNKEFPLLKSTDTSEIAH